MNETNLDSDGVSDLELGLSVVGDGGDVAGSFMSSDEGELVAERTKEEEEKVSAVQGESQWTSKRTYSMGQSPFQTWRSVSVDGVKRQR